MKIRIFQIFLLVALLFVPGFASDFAKAAEKEPVVKHSKSVAVSVPKSERETVIKNAEAYIEGLRSARARFVQTTHDGTQLVGTFYLQRPGKLRFEYDPPVKDFVIADGLVIYFYDAELKEQSNAPIGQTLADFILRDHLKLSGDLNVKNIRRGGGLLQIEITQASDPDSGTLMLGFSENPMVLKKWRVVDAQGLITEVELFYLKNNITHPEGLFVYKNPESGPKFNK
jgi:outer membrane lipoprotein-sorting protein